MNSQLFRYKGYGLIDIIRIIISIIYTKIFFKKARLLRLPIRIRLCGEIIGCENLTTGIGNRIDVFSSGVLNIGYGVQMNDFCHIACSKNITIGNNCLIASKVYITDHDHDFNCDELYPINWDLSEKIVLIGDRCWIGENVSILKGVKLGDDCVVGANSVVTKSFPSGVVIAGAPAKIIKVRNR
ncbi:DapH/DapD/GlmU-related protein [Photobacterium damselae]|uniref:Galactoside O-acetyltransferase n=1 Tax=Photobacterium damselae TaxID=38293 RepID=A0A2T3QHK3_PHODM|nr:DapH/DapD/GlmU-related protein [Photobacterium damselae]PSW83994.1 lipopolysaccharide biosynthesis protein [Photobacterium damselae]SPY28910.1 Galactoside O-acetyltransferase [Photobacterium damselae]